jgi:hypothetical protein
MCIDHPDFCKNSSFKDNGGMMKGRLHLFSLIFLLLSISCNLVDQISSIQEDAESESEELEDLVLDDQEEFGYYVLADIPFPELGLCPPQEMTLVTDLDVYQTPDLPEPEPRTPFRDPVFGTCIVRVTDRKNDILNLYDTSKGIKNEYARIQSFNADDSLLLAWSIESFWYIYDVASLMPLGEVPVLVEPRWDAHDPNLLYFTDATKLMSYDLLEGRISEIRDFANDFPGADVPAVWTRYEGSPSYDTRYWGLIANDSEWNPLAFLIYEIQTNSIVIKEIPPGYSIDNVTISPLGNYFLASFDEYCEHGQVGNDANPCGFMVYDNNLENGRSLLRIIGHYDALLDADGREVVLYQDIDTDNISMLDLETGKVTVLFPIDFSHTGIGFHFSGRASDQAGWGLVSTYNGGHPTAFTWMDNSIFAVELKPNGRVVRLAHTHSLYDENIEHDYWAEPHASVNRDFTRIIFTSNWGHTGTEEVDMYMIVLPENWIEMLP